MKPVGAFRKGEIDGKPFFIYSLFSQKDNPCSSSSSSSSSGADNHLSPFQMTLFMCPALRHDAEYYAKEDDGYDRSDSCPFTTSPHFSDIRKSCDHQVQSLLDFGRDSNFKRICKLPLVPLFWCNDKEPDKDIFWCDACLSSKLSSAYYFCTTCEKKFHKECAEAPLEIKHPSYPFHSLQLYSPSHFGSLKCTCCELKFSRMTYRCPIRKFNIDPICAMNPVPIFIDHPKRHPHPLTFFPQQTFLPCHVCGLIKESIPTYVCLQCVFVVHQDCVYSPRVIRICRHHHRISFIYSLPTGNLLCGVCRQTIVNYCGAYKCTTCRDYFVHTRCALRKDVWDGKELEDVPEEIEDVEPFKRISDGIILHFSHVHPLELEITRVYDENKFCQACILPIYEGKYYSCMDQCDFILHEACANALLKKHNVLHPHPLVLEVVNDGYDGCGYFTCSACKRESCGFVYESIRTQFSLDVRCASISEPFDYQGHEHSLFLALSREEENSAVCQICQGEMVATRKLNCIECDFIICFYCATLPYKASYKHDSHLLTFYARKEARDHSEWCDFCETKITYSRKEGFYSCDACCNTLHINCLLGSDLYMKPGQTIHYDWDFDILRNNTMSRPTCHNGSHRCGGKLVFESGNMTFCSTYCAFEY